MAKTISIVTTLYYSATFLEKFVHQCIAALQEIACSDYELIFVNDGSPDNSVPVLLELQKKNKNIIVIDLSKNFGHHHAIQAGLQNATGEFVFLIDCDLEISPMVLTQMYKEINGTNLDVVYGYQEARKGKFVERWTGFLFWESINRLSDTKIPANILTERIMTQQYVQSLLSMGDYNVFLGGMMHWVGFQQKGIPIKKELREGQSTYSIKKRINLMVNAVTSFSVKPLQVVFYIGVLISVLSFIIGGILIIRKIIYGDLVSMGWTSLIVMNIFILGIQTTILGILGIYIGKIYSQVQNRPNFIIRKIYKDE